MRGLLCRLGFHRYAAWSKPWRWTTIHVMQRRACVRCRIVGYRVTRGEVKE